MATISSAGVGSGLDVASLVEQLVAAEGDPVRTRLDRKEADLQEGLTSMATFRGVLTEFKTSLENLRSGEQLRVIDVLSSDVEEDSISITSNNQAIPTEFNVNVLQLAKSHKLTSTQFESDTSAVGSGTLTFQFGHYKEATNEFELNSESSVHTIKIEPQTNNLRGISEAINRANIGVKSIVINNGDGARLIFSSLSTGENNNLRITTSDDDGIDNDLSGLSSLAYDASANLGSGKNVHETQVAQDSILNIDGIEVRKDSNTINNVIRGVTFDVHSITENSVNVRLELNDKAAAEFISAFVTSYNELMSTVDELTGFDPNTQIAGPLSGEPAIRNIVEQLRRNLSVNFDKVNDNFISLATIGIDTERNGKLKLDMEKLNTAIAINLPEVVRLFAKTGSTQDPLVEFVSASNQTTAGKHEINITQLATKALLNTQMISVPNIKINNENNNYVFKIDGIETNNFELTRKIYNSIDELATELQTRINADSNLSEAGVSVNVTNNAGMLQISSNKFGSGSRVELVSVDTNSSELGLIVAKGIDGVDVAGTLAKQEAIGSGQVLTGTRDVEGLSVKVLAGDLGKRKNVIFSRGIAEQLDLLLNKITQADGVLATSNSGSEKRLEDITTQREVLARRLAKLEERLMKQFSALDSSLSKMQTTSEFLTNQLGGLPGARNSGGR
ncbi:hypothetical protein MNBD_GAMMA22-2145 [hydrothermal vent metagenome]|uniref:Filament cap protein n=1 Tax=hydrothermal vent metagenome TaxID=652676 RepID=A0A3B0ZXY1_9ZZZZ